WRVNLQKMRLTELSKFLSHRSAGCGGIVIRCMKEHERNGCLAHCCQQALAYLGRTLPRPSGSRKGDGGSHRAVALYREQGELTTKRVPNDGNAVGIDSGDAS